MCVAPRPPSPPPAPEPLPKPTDTVKKALTQQKAPADAMSKDNTKMKKRMGRGSLRIPLSGGSGGNFPTSP